MTETSLQLLALLVDVSWKAILVAGAVALALRVGRVRDPSLHHLVWKSVVIGMLALPALSLWAPDLRVSSPVALTSARASLEALAPSLGVQASDLARSRESWEVAQSTPARYVVKEVEEAEIFSQEATAGALSPFGAPREWPWFSMLAVVYVLGMLVMGSRLAGAWWLTRRLVAGREALNDDQWLRCREEVLGPGRRPGLELAVHPSVRVPLSTGWFRPVVLVPQSWTRWDAATRRYALTHELIHIQRGDYAAQFLAAINRCVFWFHPLSWMLSRRLAVLAEQACDQAVVTRCGHRQRYARVLLQVASALASAGPREPAWVGVAMTDGAHLSLRIQAVLAGRGKRRRWSRLAAGALVVLIAAGVAGAGALHPEPWSVAEVPVDPADPVVVLLPPSPPVAPPAIENESVLVTVVPPGVVAPDVVPPAVVPSAVVPPDFPVVPLPAAPPALVPAVESPAREPVFSDPPGSINAVLPAPLNVSSGFGSIGGSAGSILGGGTSGSLDVDAAEAYCGAPRLYILWFDDQNRAASKGARVSGPSKFWLEDAGRWIREDLCPSDRVAIVSFKGRLRIHQDFSTDRAASAEAIAEVTRRKSSRQAKLPTPGEPSLLRALPPARELARRSREISHALKLMAEVTATIEGRKDLIVLTKGFSGWNDRFGSRVGAALDSRRVLKRQHAVLLRASDVTVHVLYTGRSLNERARENVLIDGTGGWVYGAQGGRGPNHSEHDVLIGLRALARAIDLEERGVRPRT